MKVRHIRPGDTLADEEAIVRGGPLDPDTVRADAQRMHSIYGIYGISIFSLHGVTLDELAQQSPLVRFGELTVLTAAAIRSLGLRLEATGRNPRHFTIVLANLDEDVAALCRCDRRSWRNPYHEA